MHKAFQHTKLVHITAIVLSSIMLLFWVFYNGYPLFFNSDTAMYLEAAHYGSVGMDRPIMYGLFMRYLSADLSLWPVAIVQAFVLSLLVFYWFRYFVYQKRWVLYYIIFMAILSFFTGASFNAGWLMPDFFTSVSVLSMGLLLFAPQMRKFDSALVSVFFILGLVMHNSHFFISMGVLGLFMFGFIFPKLRIAFKDANIHVGRVVLVMGLAIVSNLFTASVHYHYGGGFKSSRGGVIFFMGNLVEMGIVDKYLADNCDTKHYQICQYRDTLPNNFIWASNSPIYKTGGWKGSEPEYAEIVKDIVTTPKYALKVAGMSLAMTMKQFMHFNTGEAYQPCPRVKEAFALFYPYEYSRFVRSRQYQGLLDFSFVNFTQSLIFAFSLCVYLLVLLYNKMNPTYRLMILFVLIVLLLNAWVCGTFSGVFFRYQARLVWIMPLPLALYAAGRWGTKVQSLFSVLRNRYECSPK
jgi:hypothetical protein